MSKFMDAFNVMAGRDLDGDKPRKKAPAPKKKSEPSPKKEEVKTGTSGDKPATSTKESKPAASNDRKPVASEDARYEALFYVVNKDKLSADICETLKTGAMSEDLRKLLQVLFDKKAVRELVSAQGDVRPPVDPDEYRLDFSFVNSTGDDNSAAAEALLKSGTPLDKLEDFNLKLKVVRKRVSDGSVIAEGDEKDYEAVREKIEESLKEKTDETTK